MAGRSLVSGMHFAATSFIRSFRACPLEPSLRLAFANLFGHIVFSDLDWQAIERMVSDIARPRLPRLRALSEPVTVDDEQRLPYRVSIATCHPRDQQYFYGLPRRDRHPLYHA